MLAAGRGAVASGLDASEPLLEVARERVPDGDFRVGDLESLPFADGSFDAVIAANSIQHSDDRIKALEELARVTASHGRIAVGLWSLPEKADFRVVFAAVRAVLPEPPPGDGPFGLSDPGALEGLMEAAGMAVLTAGEVECPFVYPDTETFWRASTSGASMQRAMDVVDEDMLRSAVLEAVAPYRTDGGGLRFQNVFRYVTARTVG